VHTPPASGAVDPSQATTAAELGACLRALRTAAGLSLRELEKAGRSSPLGLARSTVQAVEQGERLPKPDWLAAYLTACGVRGAQQRAWLRVRAAIAVGPGGVDTAPLRLPRVAACDPRRLGVHASITLSTHGEAAGRGAQLPELPRYVPREVDEEVREAVVEAASRSGLVVVVGSSSTGKTRTVYEAVMAELPGWRLFHPAEAEELAATVASRQLPRGGVVVWLDEAQDYLADPNRLTVGTMRALLNPDQPVVVVATMWPQWHERFTAAPPSDPGVPDLHRHARQILTTMARVIRLGEFTPGERDRAASLAGEDPRLAVALQDPNFGPTQVLAGAPQLVDRWEHASDPYAKAVMTTAIDLHRLGHLAPLPADLLCAAAPGYLTGRQQATAAPDWLAAALAYATKQLRGATAALVPVAGPRMGEVAGYVVADYLLQQGQTTRQAVPPPGSLWDSAAAHVTDAADRVRLAREASSRSLNRHAVRLVTPAAQAGNLEAMHLLAGWLWFAGHRTEMRKWVDRVLHAGNPGTLVWLASILGEIDQLQEREELLWGLAAKGHPIGLWGLIRLLNGTGRSQATEKLLGGMAEAGDPDAIWEMVERLEQRGQGPKTEGWLRRLAEDGDVIAMLELAQLLEGTARGEEAEGWLRRAAERGNSEAMLELGGLLERTGRAQEAEGWLRDAAEAGGFDVRIRLATERGRDPRLEGWLRHAAEHGDDEAMLELGGLLERDGRAQEAEGWLRQAAEAGTVRATRELVGLLERDGRGQDAEGWLRDAAERGNGEAMLELAKLLERTGRGQQAERWLRHGTELGLTLGNELASLLERTGRAQEAAGLRRFGIEPGGRTADPW
jgi:TPR repeat protein/transcriptional regulator with XRE-family HTH domain